MKLFRFFHALDWLKVFLVLVIVIGIFIRFINLDSKFYWLDEVATSVRISGYSEQEIARALYSVSPITPEEINRKFQYPNPHTSLISTIKTVIVNDPHHAPLYFITVTYWAKAFGAWGYSIALIRSLSVVLSLLALPLLYWLCLELFEFPLVGWLAMALYAISPLQLEFAQTARYYSLWLVLILATSLTLLRAIRINKRSNWLTYWASLVLGLYTFPMHVVIIIQNGIYIIFNEKFRLTQKLWSYCLVTFCSLIIFSPWLIIYLKNKDQSERMMYWVTTRIDLKEWLWIFIYNLVSLFMNFWYYIRYFPHWSSSLFPWARFLIPFVIILIFYAGYILIRCAPLKASLFLLSLIFLTSINYIAADLIFGGIRALVARYLIPAFIGIILMVAYLLARQLTIFPQGAWSKKLWQGITAILITGGLVSCLIVSPARGYMSSWPYKGLEDQVGKIINQSDKPCVFMFAGIYDVLTLSHILKPDVTLQIDGYAKVNKNWLLETWLREKRCDTLFFYETAPVKAEQFKKSYQHLPNFTMNLVFDQKKHYLWKIEASP